MSRKWPYVVGGVVGLLVLGAWLFPLQLIGVCILIILGSVWFTVTGFFIR